MTVTTLADVPDGTTWYTVSPGDGMSGPKYGGPDRAQTIDRLVALLAQGRDVKAGERFRPCPTDAYVEVARVDKIGGLPLRVPVGVDEVESLLAEARELLKANTEDDAPPAGAAEWTSFGKRIRIGGHIYTVMGGSPSPYLMHQGPVEPVDRDEHRVCGSDCTVRGF